MRTKVRDAIFCTLPAARETDQQDYRHCQQTPAEADQIRQHLLNRCQDLRHSGFLSNHTALPLLLLFPTAGVFFFITAFPAVFSLGFAVLAGRLFRRAAEHLESSGARSITMDSSLPLHSSFREVLARC